MRAVTVAVLVVPLLGLPGCSSGSAPHPSAAPPSASSRPSQPTSTASATSGPDRVRRITAAVARSAGARAASVVVAIAHPAQGELTEVGVETPVRAASTIKLLIYQARAARGPLSPADLRTAAAMIEHSDNAAATTLWRQAGGTSGLAAEVARLHLGRTTPTTTLLEPWDGWLTTARDLTSELVQVVASPAASDRELLRLMRAVEPAQRWGVGRLAPAGQAAVKNGWVPVTGQGWVVSTTGCVGLGSADPVCLAVTTTGNASFSAGVRLVDAVTPAVYAADRGSS